MVPVANSSLLLESPDRLIRRLAAELARRDREEWNAKAKAERRTGGKKTRAQYSADYRAKNPDRARWFNFNSNRRVKGQPTLSFEEYLEWRANKGRKTGPKVEKESRYPFSKGAYHNHNSYRRKKGLPIITYDEFVKQRIAKAEANGIDIGDAAKDESVAREARYQRLKERLKNEPKTNETRASVLGIRTPRQLSNDAMENDSTTQHMLDKMVRQEGGSHIGSVARFGWYSLGEGCHWKGKGRGWR